MNKVTRAFVMTGVAAAAGLAMGAGPAAAAPATTSAPSVTAAGTAAGQEQDVRRRDRIYGFYNNPGTCHRIGKIGQYKRQWQRYSCFKVYRGFHSGDWALKVYYGWNYNHGNKHWNNGPDMHHWNNGPQGGHSDYGQPAYGQPAYGQPGPYQN
ncbi:hypothetical protein [Actinoplanes utahensis]|uniref:Uncharacterized protein n=1 Tax=Actinoplanes utahensis TaxID=1869 RepID=A0A0A6XF96_ACTUT|nr:hypothetical protein [Actinoplanes utahensis]KHD78767.1 hypothetical protein MB27_03875 [Actinoplanes utahensis]GIF32131.1 hypothetical protein Aut01nite_51170 [Actinoplanes utahensis]